MESRKEKTNVYARARFEAERHRRRYKRGKRWRRGNNGEIERRKYW